MDNQKDFYIKEKLQKDKLISKKADDVFNNFLKGDFKMVEENETNTEEKVSKNIKNGKQKFKKIWATAACLLIVFGAANVYASTQGYENIFFMIKYLVTGDSSVISNKDEILSDRDITISYEPIKLNDNLEIQIKKLQIKDNVAKLFIVVNEDDSEKVSSIVPLKYEVYNDSNETLCSQNSYKATEPSATTYTEELVLDNLKNDDQIINLKIYKSDNTLMTSLSIDLDKRVIEVEGEAEALEKISEIELKEFLEEVSGLYGDDGKVVDDDDKVLFAINLLSVNDKLEEKDISGETYYNAEPINNALKEFANISLESFTSGEQFELVKKNGVEYYKVIYGGDGVVFSECIDVSNISYCAGIYTATYTYCRLGEESIFDVDINDYDILQNTVSFTLNTDGKYSKFKLQSVGTPEVIKSKDEKEGGTLNNNTTTSNVTSTDTTSNTSTTNTNTTTTNTTTNTVTNTATSTDTNTTTQTGNSTSSTATDKKVDNYASTMSWTEYWAPGLKFSYPTIFELSEIGGYYRGNRQGEVSTEITGVAVGIDPDTKEIINSNLTITIYEPLITFDDVDYLKNYNTGYGRPCTTTSSGLVWYEDYSDESAIKYTLIEELTDGASAVYNIVFSTDNFKNYKVTNIMNWLIGSTKLTSY
jgi:hypothetical protein